MVMKLLKEVMKMKSTRDSETPTRTLFVEWLAKLVNASQVFALGSFGFELLILLRSQKSAKLNNRTELARKSLK